jgi:hypothetical protein
MTLGSDFVFSTERLTNEKGELTVDGKHELHGHVPQGIELGPLFMPEYMLDWLDAYLVMDELDKHGYSISLHDAHPMEVDANYRAGLDLAPSLVRK